MDPTGPPLDEAEVAAWRMFLRAHAAVTKTLEAELLAAHNMSLASFDVLVQLAEAPEQRLRMSELAGAVLLSRSGLTRLVDRLVDEGLVARRSCDHDARGTYTVLTDAGRRRLAEAAPVHLAGVRTHFTARLDAGQLRVLTDVCSRLVEPAWPTRPDTGGRRAPAEPATWGTPPAGEGKPTRVPER